MTRFEELQRSDGSGASCDVTETWTEMTQVGCGRVKCGGEATSRLFLQLEYVGVNAKTKERNCPAGKDSYLSRISGLERGHFIRFNDFCCWGRKKGTRRKTTVCAEQHVGTSRCMINRRSQTDVVKVWSNNLMLYESHITWYNIRSTASQPFQQVISYSNSVNSQPVITACVYSRSFVRPKSNDLLLKTF